MWRFEFNFQMLSWSYYYPKLAWASENENAAIDEALLSVVVVAYSSSSRSFSSLTRVVLWAADLASFSQGAAPPQRVPLLRARAEILIWTEDDRVFSSTVVVVLRLSLSLSHFLSRRLLFLLLLAFVIACFGESVASQLEAPATGFCSSFEEVVSWLASLSLFRKLLSRRLLSSPSPKALLPFPSPILAISSSSL